MTTPLASPPSTYPIHSLRPSALPPGGVAGAAAPTDEAGPRCPGSTPPPPFFEFKGPDYFLNYKVPPDAILVGDFHVARGDLMVLAGVPGCGKSRLLMSLAVAGARGKGTTWMGLPVHARFKTMILQAENGLLRLKQELGEIQAHGHDLGRNVLITAPPDCGLAFDDPTFCQQLREVLARERPGVFALDPWNAAVPDDKARDFRTALDAVRSCLPKGPDKPALVIVHHLRKSGANEGRKHGRDLLNELSGSYVIGSSCRSAFVLEPASPEPEDTRVVFTCVKNNNGSLGPPSAWHRQNGLFAPSPDFDWKLWREGDPGGRPAAVGLEDLAAIFANEDEDGTGTRPLMRHEAAKALTDRTGAGKSAIYAALKPDGRFSTHLREEGGFLWFESP